jgi:hypothetical protein
MKRWIGSQRMPPTNPLDSFVLGTVVAMTFCAGTAIADLVAKNQVIEDDVTSDTIHEDCHPDETGVLCDHCEDELAGL